MNAPIIDLAEARFRRRATALYRRGPRPIIELLEQAARDRLLGTYFDQLIERYLAIPDIALDVTGGREMPPSWPEGSS